METIRQTILDHIEDSRAKVTVMELEKFVCHRIGSKRSDFRQALRNIVEAGLVDYTYLHGCSFVEKSFKRPVRIGSHIILKPCGLSVDPGEKNFVVELERGIAFGGGRHPSTRLALEGIEFLLSRCGWFKDRLSADCLDIGTGSGVLALTALLMGVDRAVGIDTDPCALFEAKTNAVKNGVKHRFEISGEVLSQVRGKFDLIIANLRTPTLKTILPDVVKRIQHRGALIFSGFRDSEGQELIALYRREKMKCRWEKCEKGWQATVLVRE